MGRSQARRLREAARRFGREDEARWSQTRESIGRLIYGRKTEANIMPHVYSGPARRDDPHAVILWYSTAYLFEKNRYMFGSNWKK